ncbi:zinc finger BED domain-containing protein RICESLEEPER 2-like protein [Tanacetum coccineum]
MSVAAVLDPRCKMTVAKFTFPRMYSGDELKANIKKVEDALSELYKEYVSEYYSSGEQSGETNVGSTSTNVTITLHFGFDVLAWWRSNSLWYRILSGMARDILAIPITTVASEATFSAGLGVRWIDTYRASLAPETVEVLLCGGDWCRKRKDAIEGPPSFIEEETYVGGPHTHLLACMHDESYNYFSLYYGKPWNSHRDIFLFGNWNWNCKLYLIDILGCGAKSCGGVEYSRRL